MWNDWTSCIMMVSSFEWLFIRYDDIVFACDDLCLCTSMVSSCVKIVDRVHDSVIVLMSFACWESTSIPESDGADVLLVRRQCIRITSWRAWIIHWSCGMVSAFGIRLCLYWCIRQASRSGGITFQQISTYKLCTRASMKISNAWRAHNHVSTTRDVWFLQEATCGYLKLNSERQTTTKLQRIVSAGIVLHHFQTHTQQSTAGELYESPIQTGQRKQKKHEKDFRFLQWGFL